jgi:hypothetical protein
MKVRHVVLIAVAVVLMALLWALTPRRCVDGDVPFYLKGSVQGCGAPH